jgi:hypothetical protein
MPKMVATPGGVQHTNSVKIEFSNGRSIDMHGSPEMGAFIQQRWQERQLGRR